MKLESRRISKTAAITPPEILNGSTPENWLSFSFRYGGIGMTNVRQSGVYRRDGWEFNFRPFLKQFLFSQRGSCYTAWAKNRTNLRNSTVGKIKIIQELEN